MALRRVARVGLPARLREFRRQPGGCTDFSSRRVLGHHSPSAFAPRSPASLSLRAVELGNTLGVGRGHRQDREVGQGSVGLDGKQRRRARCYDKAHQARDRIQAVPASAGGPRWAIGPTLGRTLMKTIHSQMRTQSLVGEPASVLQRDAPGDSVAPIPAIRRGAAAWLRSLFQFACRLFSRISASGLPSSRARRYQSVATARSPRTPFRRANARKEGS